MTAPLFDVASVGQLADHVVSGFDKPIPTICYAGPALQSGFPIGAIATGYFELKGDGTLGLSSIYNSYVPQMGLAGALLYTVAADVQLTSLDAAHAEIYVLAHFPVLNMRFATKDGNVIWLRAFTQIIPGDAEASNTPGVVFEVFADKDVTVQFALNIGHNVEPVVQPLELPAALTNGAGRQYFHGADYRASFVLASLDPRPDDVATAADDKASFNLRLVLKAGVQRGAVFAWHLPWWIDSSMEPHMNRYASRFKSAIDVAQHLRTNRTSTLKKIIAWQTAIYRSGLPEWVSNALVQSVYSFAKNTIWVDEHRPDRWYEPNGLFVHSESFRGCPISETMVCRAHGHFLALLLWPELEKSTLAGFAHFQLRSGEVPFSFGQPTALRDPRYHCQHPLTSSQFVQQVHRYFLRTNDLEFLKRFWPNVADASKYMAFLDYDDDGLINEAPHALPGDHWPANQFYDWWPWRGTSSYVSSQGLAAWRSIAAMADVLENSAAHEQAAKQVARGLESFRTKLWTGSYFRLWHDDKLGNNDTCLANQIMGQWACRVANVESLFSVEETRAVYAAVEKYNAPVTQFGIINAGNFQGDVAEAGTPDMNFATMIFVGENLCAAMTAMYDGVVAGARWAETIVRTLHEHQACPFDQRCLIRPDDGQPAWGNDYYSNLIVWALPMAIQRIGIREYVAEGALISKILGAVK